MEMHEKIRAGRLRLGESIEHARRVSPEEERQIDEILGLQTISIRLPKQMIEAYKLIAAYHGVGYQPLMRDILQRWVKEGLSEVVAAQEAKSDEARARVQELQEKKAA